MAQGLIYIIGLVALWWVGNTIATIFSKMVMNEGKEAIPDVLGLSAAFLDFRWIELTLLQHVLGGVVGLIWLKLIKREYLYPERNIGQFDIILASIGNLVGNLATNAAYSFVSSSSVQILKGIEPLVTFVLAIFLYRTGGMFTVEILLSILVICVGASSFVVWDSSFNIWGVIAALASDIAFPVRNIFLKRIAWENALQKYTLLSLLSATFLMPAFLAKLLIRQSFWYANIEYSTLSSLFHFLYNFTSISVLQNVTPLTHSILNLSKRMFVVVLNIIYFLTPLSKNMLFGLLTFFLGITVFQLYNNRNMEQSRFMILKSNRIVKSILVGFLSTICLLFVAKLVLETKETKHTKYDKILTAWLYNDPIPEDVVRNVESFLDYSEYLYVYCGTTQCINALHPLSTKEHVTIQFLDISKIVIDTPFESWFARQVYHKILTGRNFELHLHEVVKVSLLWHYGGLYINPRMALVKDQYLPDYEHDSWTSFATGVSDGNVRTPLDISFFHKGHPMLTKLATDFVNNYPSEMDDNTNNWPIEYFYRKVFIDSLKKSCDKMDMCIHEHAISSQVLGANLQNSSICHFGTLTYDTRVASTGLGNLGDEVQSFPGIQFLPYIDTFLDREELVSPFNDPILVFFNAWWGDSRTNFPPPENIDPISLGMHFKSALRGRSNILEFVKHSRFIGSRDMDTYNWLRSIGVETFFSSCLTLLTKSPSISREKPKSIYLVDVKKEFLDLIPSEVRQVAITLKQNAAKEILHFRFKRIQRAFKMIEAYSQAKLVITQRIHCALPSAAMGIPVLFINSNDMPGGLGTSTVPSPRTVGLLDYFHTVDTYSISKKKAAEFLLQFNYSSPPSNPNVNLLMRARAVNWNVIRQRQPLYDAAKKFGLLPLSSFQAHDNELVFHFVITSSRRSFIFDSSHPNLITLRNRLSIESVLYHYPLSRVLIHTNALYQTDFEVYTESGYRLEVLSYELEEMLKISPNEIKFDIKLIEAIKKNNDWPQFEKHLVQLLVLYQSGGVYLNTDTILLWPFGNNDLNLFSFVKENSIDFLTFMKFKEKHPIIKYLLENIISRYNLGTDSLELMENWSNESANNKIGHLRILESADIFNCLIQLNEETISNLRQYSLLTLRDTTANQFFKTDIKCSSIWEWVIKNLCIVCDEIL